jgi:hypothetical protein
VTLRYGSTVKSGKQTSMSAGERDPKKMTWKMYNETLDTQVSEERAQQSVLKDMEQGRKQQQQQQQQALQEAQQTDNSQTADVKSADSTDGFGDQTVDQTAHTTVSVLSPFQGKRRDMDKSVLEHSQGGVQFEFNQTLVGDPSWGNNPTENSRVEARPLPTQNHLGKSAQQVRGGTRRRVRVEPRQQQQHQTQLPAQSRGIQPRVRQPRKPKGPRPVSLSLAPNKFVVAQPQGQARKAKYSFEQPKKGEAAGKVKRGDIAKLFF